MLTKIFAVYDEKAQAHLPPFFMNHEGQAIRTFTDCIQSSEHQFSHHPADYTLFQIGVFDDGSAHITTETPLKSLGNGVEFINSPTQTELIPDVQIGNET